MENNYDFKLENLFDKLLNKKMKSFCDFNEIRNLNINKNINLSGGGNNGLDTGKCIKFFPANQAFAKVKNYHFKNNTNENNENFGMKMENVILPKINNEFIKK